MNEEKPYKMLAERVEDAVLAMKAAMAGRKNFVLTPLYYVVYQEPPIDAKDVIEHVHYDWSLNKQEVYARGLGYSQAVEGAQPKFFFAISTRINNDSRNHQIKGLVRAAWLNRGKSAYPVIYTYDPVRDLEDELEGQSDPALVEASDEIPWEEPVSSDSIPEHIEALPVQNTINITGEGQYNRIDFKYPIGATLYFMGNTTIESFVVFMRQVIYTQFMDSQSGITQNEITRYYYSLTNAKLPEERLFSSPQALADHLVASVTLLNNDKEPCGF